MPEIDYAALSNEELLTAKKSLKSTKIINAVLIGFAAGIAGVAFWAKGFKLPFLLPAFLTYLLYKGSKKTDALESELKKRNL
ncbi:hypothetical protein [Soonwooa sp.]|uniref:hypothetical protein n=1 Tax=Soonwooa sp. TaxID=1938592 RepID=UPI0026210DAC|nr:hypothetical protein [Soonwooa sp.]